MTEITITSYPLNEIGQLFTVTPTYNANMIVKNLWIDISEAPTDQYIEIAFDGVVKKTLLITDECRYTPVDIVFQNKDGGTQSITMFKARRDTLIVEKETFEGSRDIPNHQFIDYNVNGKEKLNVNTGFLTEDKNESIKQLLLSERVWMLEGVIAIPLRVTTTTQEFKTRQNDRMINYAIEFEHAYFENNNV